MLLIPTQQRRAFGAVDLSKRQDHWIQARQLLTRSTYSPVRESTLMTLPSLMNPGTMNSAPVSTLAGLVTLVAVSPLAPGAHSVTSNSMEILEEEKTLIKGIELENILSYNFHPTNTVHISGILPQDKQKMIAQIDAGIIRYGEDALSRSVVRISL